MQKEQTIFNDKHAQYQQYNNSHDDDVVVNIYWRHTTLDIFHKLFHLITYPNKKYVCRQYNPYTQQEGHCHKPHKSQTQKHRYMYSHYWFYNNICGSLELEISK